MNPQKILFRDTEQRIMEAETAIKNLTQAFENLKFAISQEHNIKRLEEEEKQGESDRQFQNAFATVHKER